MTASRTGLLLTYSLYLLVLNLPHSAAAASTITSLGALPGKSNSTAAGVSNDGQVVAGTSTDNKGLSGQAFLWTPSGGMVGLGFLPGGTTSLARAISRDGSTVVGDSTSTYSQPYGGTEAFRYANGTIGAMHTPFLMSQGWAVNTNGTVVTDSNGSVRWTLAGGTDMNTIPYAGFGISDDGSVIVGRSSGFIAQRWTAADGIVNLPNTSGAFSDAKAVSGNGQVAVGQRSNVACYWSQTEGFVSIGTNGVVSTALAASYDGSIIVGRGNIGPSGGTSAFVWTRQTGMQMLSTTLANQGVDLSAWVTSSKTNLVEATGISDDGTYIVGNGTKTGFLVQLQLTAPPSLIEQWRNTAFGSTANSGSAADTADPDTDGSPNLLEYALNSDPNQTGSFNKPTGNTVANHVVFGFTRIADPALTYSVEATDSLTNPTWTSIWSSTGLSNTAGHVDVTDSLAISGQTSHFLRLKISH